MFSLADHLERIKSMTVAGHSHKSVVEWIQQHTFIGGKPFSFKHHEYQERILRSEAPIISVKKCSQVGISEMSFRRALALCDIMPNFTVLYTLPTAKFAGDVMKTRIDPIIEASPRLSSTVSNSVDNTSVKKFGDDSFLYLKGTVGTAQAISIPVDALVHDEVDFSDIDVISSYQSRLTHSPYKWQFNLSTPTVAGYGIDSKFRDSRKFYNFVECSHCGHWFVPDYLEHCRVPGYSGNLLDITANSIHKYDVDGASLHCPRCDCVPDLSPAHREWVCENPDDKYDAEGYQVSPFDAPAFITVPFLVRASTAYKKKTDFINFNLGQCAEDADSGLQMDDINKAYQIQAEYAATYVMGIDVGLDCHIMVGGVDGWGKLHVLKTLVVNYRDLETTFFRLCSEFPFSAIVMDSQPYVETVFRLQQKCPVLYGSVYVRTKSIEAFRLRDQDEDGSKGLLEVRQVNVNRDYALDALMVAIRGGAVSIREDENRALIETHLRDMKRIKELGKYSGDEDRYTWRKSEKGTDHFHHAMLYLYVASQLRGVSQFNLLLPPLVGSFRVRS